MTTGHRKIFTAAVCVLLTLTGVSQAAILASWDEWADANQPYVADDVLAGFSAQIGMNADRVISPFGSTDGTFGTVSGATTSDQYAVLVRQTGSALVVDLTLTNNTGIDYTVESIHFDFAPRRNNTSTTSGTGPNSFTLTYLTGGLGPDNTQIAAESDLPYHITANDNNNSDFPDYDYDLSSALSDLILGDGESAQFQLVFSDQTDLNVSSILDNVAIVGSTAVIPTPAALTGGLVLLGAMTLGRRR
ncbi:hypothetical protein HED60_07820 [Planctomycetales bacterium ZRK34]|nr:hypothetical protein HED60_07820 [Planctomycetales bacterium ZRK34]